MILHKDYILDNAHDLTDALRIDICTDYYKEFIDKLNSVEVVISSSLHGIILAEAYGIPAILLKPQIDILKYYDYYYGTKRFDFPVANTLAEARNIKPVELPNLNEMREKIINVFPYDVYN